MSSEPNEVLKRVTNEDEQKKDRKRKSTEMDKANHRKRKYATTHLVLGGHTLVTMRENYYKMFTMMFPLNTLRK